MGPTRSNMANVRLSCRFDYWGTSGDGGICKDYKETGSCAGLILDEIANVSKKIGKNNFDGTDALEHGERAALLPLRLLGHQRRRRDLQGLQGDRVLRGLSGADAIIVFP